MNGHISDVAKKMLNDPEARKQLNDALLQSRPRDIKIGAKTYRVSFYDVPLKNEVTGSKK